MTETILIHDQAVYAESRRAVAIVKPYSEAVLAERLAQAELIACEQALAAVPNIDTDGIDTARATAAAATKARAGAIERAEQALAAIRKDLTDVWKSIPDAGATVAYKARTDKLRAELAERESTYRRYFALTTDEPLAVADLDAAMARDETETAADLKHIEALENEATNRKANRTWYTKKIAALTEAIKPLRGTANVIRAATREQLVACGIPNPDVHLDCARMDADNRARPIADSGRWPGPPVEPEKA